MLLRMTAVILAVMSLTACATRPSTVESIAPPNGARVGIVSSFPSQIRLATFGQFEGATLDLVDVSNPLLSDVATNAAKIVMSGRYQFVDVKVSGVIIDTDTPMDKVTNETRVIETEVRKRVHSDAPVDYYLVICQGNAAQPYTEVPEVNIGIGVSKVLTIWGHAPILHTYLQMSWIDAKTGKLLAGTPLAIKPRALEINPVEDRPIERLDGFEWQKYWRDMSDAQRQLIKDHIVKMLEQSVQYTVKQMKIAP